MIFVGNVVLEWTWKSSLTHVNTIRARLHTRHAVVGKSFAQFHYSHKKGRCWEFVGDLAYVSSGLVEKQDSADLSKCLLFCLRWLVRIPRIGIIVFQRAIVHVLSGALRGNVVIIRDAIDDDVSHISIGKH